MHHQPQPPLPRGPHSSMWTRRTFLRTTALWAGLAPFVASRGFGAAKSGSPNTRLQHACIGVGGMGWGDLNNFKQHDRVDIVALCDVDANTLDNAAKAVPGAR